MRFRSDKFMKVKTVHGEKELLVEGGKNNVVIIQPDPKKPPEHVMEFKNGVYETKDAKEIKILKDLGYVEDVPLTGVSEEEQDETRSLAEKLAGLPSDTYKTVVGTVDKIKSLRKGGKAKETEEEAVPAEKPKT